MVAERSPGASPAARLASAKFLNTCLEIFNGLRPVGHARQLAHPLYAQAVLAALTHATRRLRQAPRPATGRTATGRAALVKVRRLRVCEPRPGRVEIAAAIGYAEPAPPAPGRAARSAGSASTMPGRRPGQRTWAAAFRLERHHDRWQCTAAAIL